MTVHAVESSRALAAARARRAAKQWVDSYRPAGKLCPAVCTQCHATHWEGRWRWDVPQPDLVPVVCPACQRLRDGVAAHVLELAGALPPHWQEVKGLLGNVERAELEEHPMERVMKVEIGDDKVLVGLTGMHIARRLIAALGRRFRKSVRLVLTETVTRIEWLEPHEVESKDLAGR